jgi:hypothetical protein
VYLRLQPYIQSSLALRSNAKLAFRFFEPFQVEQTVGDRSYKLKLPSESKLHPVFHVLQLRKRVPPAPVHQELPHVDDLAPHLQVPQQVLQTRQVRRRHKVLEQALVRWSGLSASLATWENIAELKTRFPRAPAWGQAAHEEGKNVMGSSGTAHVPGPQEGLAQRPRRAPRPNPRYTGEDWTG